jgi:hypothetical protein
MAIQAVPAAVTAAARERIRVRLRRIGVRPPGGDGLWPAHY